MSYSDYIDGFSLTMTSVNALATLLEAFFADTHTYTHTHTHTHIHEGIALPLL